MPGKTEKTRAGIVGEWITPPATRAQVLAPCESKTGGHWYCATHREEFPNQLTKDSHISGRGQHVLVWICDEHGPEAP